MNLITRSIPICQKFINKRERLEKFPVNDNNVQHETQNYCLERRAMENLLKDIFIVTATLFFIVDPVGAVPSFLALTAEDDQSKRRTTARKASTYCFVILIVFCLTGKYIFRIFGIGLPAFRIAGGVVLGLVGLDMLRAYRTTQEGKIEFLEAAEKDDVAVTPLAIPMLAGPGALSTVMMFSAPELSVKKAITVCAGIFATCCLTYIVLSLANKINGLLGKTGTRILTRIMGLIILAVAAQYFLDGLKEAKLLD